MAHIFKGDFSRLESEERKISVPREKIVDMLGIREGMTIADFGCGIGYFTFPIAEKVGEKGKVIAIDISENMIEEMKKRTKGKTNITLIKSDSLNGIKADIITAFFVAHEVPDLKVFLRECFESLGENGRFFIIDWHKKKTPNGPPVGHRVSEENLVIAAGIEPKRHFISKDFYFLEFLKY